MAKSRGFTLVEVCITVAILALAAAVVVPAISSVSRAELRKAASAVAGTVRATYDNAALSGETYRMVFAFGKPVVRIEATDDELHFDEKSGAFVTATEHQDELDKMDDPPQAGPRHNKSKEPEPKEPSDTPPSALGGLLGISKMAQKAARKGFVDKGKLALSADIRLLDMWTDGMDQAVAEGEVYLYFFPSGYTQEALIHLEDAERRVFTVKINALTGRASIIDSYVEVPK